MIISMDSTLPEAPQQKGTWQPRKGQPQRAVHTASGHIYPDTRDWAVTIEPLGPSSSSQASTETIVSSPDRWHGRGVMVLSALSSSAALQAHSIRASTQVILSSVGRIAGMVISRELSPRLEKITTNLERLNDGWAGPDTKAPSQAIISNISQALLAMPVIEADPEVEVDDDGTVTLEWRRDRQAFCLTFSESDYVIGTISPWSEKYRPWRLHVSDEIALADRFDDPQVLAFTQSK